MYKTVAEIMAHMQAAHEPYFMNGWVNEYAIRSARSNGWFRPRGYDEIVAELKAIGYIAHPKSPKKGYYGTIFIKRDSPHVDIPTRHLMVKQFLRDQGFSV